MASRLAGLLRAWLRHEHRARSSLPGPDAQARLAGWRNADHRTRGIRPWGV